MAESGGASSGGKGLGKVFQKTVIRTKEKMMQNLGKADKTRDEDFEQHVLYFNDQQATATRLQKDLKHYITCVKEMSLASQTMYKSVKETYEPSWSGYSETVSSAELLSTLWEDYLTKLSDQLQNPLSAYAANFPDMKAKISKRGRKLTDFDSARHNYEASVGAKKQDDAKVTKALEELNEAKHVYHSINSELNEELPALYQSRVAFLASYFNSLFTTEAVFDRECSKLKDVMAEMTGKLCEEAERGDAAQVFRAKSIKTDRLPSSTELDRRSRGSESKGGRGAESEAGRGAESARQATNSESPSGGRRDAHLSRMDSNNKGLEASLGVGVVSSSRIESAPTPTPRIQLAAAVPGEAGEDPGMSRRSGGAGGDYSGAVRISGGAGGDPVIMSGGGAVVNGRPGKNSNVEAAAARASQGPASPTSLAGPLSPSGQLGLGSPSVLPGPSSPMSPGNSASLAHDSNEEEEEEREEGAGAAQNVYSLAKDTEDVYRVPTNNEPVEPSSASQPASRVLFKVVATHRYQGDDADELNFEPGEVISVVPFDDPEEQDEGWLTGIMESTKQKGVFPENFTRRL